MAGSAGRLGSRDVERVFASGWTISTPYLAVKGLERQDASGCRISVVAGKKLGTAPGRNRGRRRTREAIRAAQAPLPASVDLVFVVRPPLLKTDSVELRAEIERVLDRVTQRAGAT
jgi:ribonuclease P protein component